MNPLGIVGKGLRLIGSRGAVRATGWIGVLLTLGEIGWFTAKKGKLLEKFTHYYCAEGSMCGKMIPDDLVEKELKAEAQKDRAEYIVVKCPNCPNGKRTINRGEWEKMKKLRKKWQ